MTSSLCFTLLDRKGRGGGYLASGIVYGLVQFAHQYPGGECFQRLVSNPLNGEQNLLLLVSLLVCFL